MNTIEVFIAVSNYLTREGLKTLVKQMKGYVVNGEAENSEDLAKKIVGCQPDVLIIDYTGELFNIESIGYIVNFLPHTQILAVTSEQSKSDIVKALKAGVKSYVLSTCGRQEIADAITATANGEKFFCTKVLDRIMSDVLAADSPSEASCDPVKVSDREAEIIRMIAEGFTNKEIADKLYLSTHTVNTHRKNIMSKLGINNTAGIVLYAVKHDLISPNKFLFSN